MMGVFLAMSWSQALRLLRGMREKGLSPDRASYTTVMECCSKAGQWELELTLLQEMMNDGLTPDRYALNTAIGACAKGGQWRRSIALLDSIQVSQETCFTSLMHPLLSHCSFLALCMIGPQYREL